MKQNSILFVLIFATGYLFAQDVKTNREQLRKLNFMAGSWRGEATIQQRGGAPTKVNQEERIEWRLDSLVLTIEGTGTDPVTKKVTFHAFAVIGYNQQTKQLAMRSFMMDGRQTDAYFSIIEDHQFAWGFDVPTGKIKYSIVLSPENKTWNEKGEFSTDGSQWYPFMEMNLLKQH